MQIQAGKRVKMVRDEATDYGGGGADGRWVGGGRAPLCLLHLSSVEWELAAREGSASKRSCGEQGWEAS